MDGPRFRWNSSARSDVGLVRRINEDACLALPEAGLWAVADGMGGHAFGEVASAMVIDALAALVRQTVPATLDDHAEAVRLALQVVNHALREQALMHDVALVGTTVVVLLALQGECAVLWAGDSRAYLMRRGTLQQLTRDHAHVSFPGTVHSIGSRSGTDTGRGDDSGRESDDDGIHGIGGIYGTGGTSGIHGSGGIGIGSAGAAPHAVSHDALTGRIASLTDIPAGTSARSLDAGAAGGSGRARDRSIAGPVGMDPNSDVGIGGNDGLDVDSRGAPAVAPAAATGVAPDLVPGTVPGVATALAPGVTVGTAGYFSAGPEEMTWFAMPATDSRYPASSGITRAVGAADALVLDELRFPIEDGDVLLLCSDGLTREVEATDIARLLAPGNSRHAAQALVALALQQGGRDNVSVVVIAVDDCWSADRTQLNPAC